MKLSLRTMIPCVVCVLVLAGLLFWAGGGKADATDRKIDKVVSKMTLDEKVSQMIIPACRTWNDENITDLDAVPEIKAALQKHQYGGVILYGANITGNEQVTRLIYALQQNNSRIENVSVNIPYLMPVDEEGGVVIRLQAGTRMTGNMAIGATKDSLSNAEKTGRLLGEELAAVGFNADFAPVIDVNNNPSNPVIGTRSFSDDPNKVAELGMAYARGLAQNNIIATYKHFPGHGDTETDSHIGTPSVAKTYDEISAAELVPFKEAIENGADMIMTAHITYPLIDDEVTFGDGVTKGYFPATMSKKIITDILRGDLGYNGVIVADALEMDAVDTSGLVKGEADSAEYHVNMAEKVINAGVDILLLPVDMKDPQAIEFYDEYIYGIIAKVESGEISEDTIDESVKRILQLKTKYGIFDINGKNDEPEDIETKAAKSKEIVGNQEHHDIEEEMARQVITLLKNDENLLPLNSDKKSIFILGRLNSDEKNLSYSISKMKEEGLIGNDTDVTIDYYYDSSADVKLHYTDEMKEKISSADVVIGLSYASGNSALDEENPQHIAVASAIDEVHKGGGKFILISDNLPYDAAIYQDADAILLAYLGSGLGIDPTDKLVDTGTTAINANVIAAVETIFGANSPKGSLPVNIPKVEEGSDGKLQYGNDYLYERGYGLSY